MNEAITTDDLISRIKAEVGSMARDPEGSSEAMDLMLWAAARLESLQQRNQSLWGEVSSLEYEIENRHSA